MNIISHTTFAGERACFALKSTRFEQVVFLPGESPLKHTHNIELAECVFKGKYPLWHADAVYIVDSVFNSDARAAIWYSRNLTLNKTRVDAPKMFRESSGLVLENVHFSTADESCWHCHDIALHHVSVDKGDYFLMNSSDIRIRDLNFQGNYCFQNTRNVSIHNARISAKDAFWGAEDVAVFDSVLEGEYLGWHSKNLRLVNCTIRGTQPLCYAEDLILENCIMEDTDLCFEYSTLQADVVGEIQSVRNPKSGRIYADSIGEIIIDNHCIDPGACVFESRVKAADLRN